MVGGISYTNGSCPKLAATLPDRHKAMVGNEVRATPSPSMSEDKPPTSISNNYVNSSASKSSESAENTTSSRFILFFALVIWKFC